MSLCSVRTEFNCENTFNTLPYVHDLPRSLVPVDSTVIPRDSEYAVLLERAVLMILKEPWRWEKRPAREKALGEPMRVHKVAHRTWPGCYSVGCCRDIVRQMGLGVIYRNTFQFQSQFFSNAVAISCSPDSVHQSVFPFYLPSVQYNIDSVTSALLQGIEASW